MTFLNKWFKFDERNATFKKELIGGIVTFLSMAYILAVQPGMLSTLNVPGESEVMPRGAVFLTTAISSFVATFAMGLFANVPVGLAPGMGINAFFVYTVCIVMKIPVDEALAIVLISGWLYFAVVVTPARKIINKAFPRNLKLAIGAAIGFFIAYLGLQETGIIQSDAATPAPGVVISATAVKLGNLKNPLIILAFIVMILMFAFHFLKIKGGMLLAMLVGVVIMAIMYGAGVKELKGEHGPFTLNNFSDQFDDLGVIAGKSYTAIPKALSHPISYIAIFVFLYTDFFDTTGTLFAIDEEAGFSKRDPKGKWMNRANMVDAVGTVFGASIGSTTVTTFAESNSGIAAGARTGFASIITGTLFLLTIAIWPIMNPLLPIEAVPGLQEGYTPHTYSPITSPAMILVGSLMMMQLKEFKWGNIIDVPTLFITILFTVFTSSISSGIAAGVIMFTAMNFAAGLMQRIKKWRNKGHFNVSSQGEILGTGLEKEKIDEGIKIDDYWKRLNIPILILFVFAMVYFGTTVLYEY